MTNSTPDSNSIETTESTDEMAKAENSEILEGGTGNAISETETVGLAPENDTLDLKNTAEKPDSDDKSVQTLGFEPITENDANGPEMAANAPDTTEMIADTENTDLAEDVVVEEVSVITGNKETKTDSVLIEESGRNSEPSTPAASPAICPPFTDPATLAVLGTLGNAKKVLNREQAYQKILTLGAQRPHITNTEVQQALRISKTSSFRYLKELAKRGRLRRVGRGRSTRYMIVV